MDNLIAPTLSFSNTPVKEYGLPVQTISDFTKLAVQTDLQNKASIDELQVLQKNVKSNNFGQEGEYLKGFIKNTDDDITSFSESNDMAYGTSFVNNLKKNFATDKTLQGIQASYQMRQGAIERSTKKNDEGWSNYWTNGAIGLGDERSKEGVHLDANGNVTGLYNAYELPKFSDVAKDLLEALSKAHSNTTTTESSPTSANAPFEMLRSTKVTKESRDIDNLVREGKQYLKNDSKSMAVINAMVDIDTYYAKRNGMFDNGAKGYFDANNQGAISKQLATATTTLDGTALQDKLSGIVGNAQALRISNLPKDQRLAALSAAKLDLFQTAFDIEKQDLIKSNNLTPEQALAKDKVIDQQILANLYNNSHLDNIIQGIVHGSADILDYHDSSITYSYMEDRAAVAENKRKADEDVWQASGGDLNTTTLMSLVKTTSDGLAKTSALLKASAPDLDFNNPTAAAAYFAKAGNTANVNALKEQYNNYLTLKETANQQNSIIRTSLKGLSYDAVAPSAISSQSELDPINAIAFKLYQQGYSIEDASKKAVEVDRGKTLQHYKHYPNFDVTKIIVNNLHSIVEGAVHNLPVDKQPRSTGIIMGMTGGRAQRIASDMTNAVINGTGNYDILSSTDGDMTSTADKNCTLSKANPNSSMVYTYNNPSLPAGSSYINMTWTTGDPKDLQHHSAIMKLQDGGNHQQRALEHMATVVNNGTYDNNPSTKASLNTSIVTGTSNFVNAYPVNNDNNGKPIIQFGAPSSLSSKVKAAFQTAITAPGTQRIGTDIGIIEITHAGADAVSAKFIRPNEEGVNVLISGNDWTTSENEVLESVTTAATTPRDAKEAAIISTHNANAMKIKTAGGIDRHPTKYHRKPY